MSEKKKVLLAVPNVNWIHRSVVETILYVTDDDRHEVQVSLPAGRPVDANRNSMIVEFLNSDFEFLLFIDSDNPPMRHIKPLDLIEKDLDIVGLPTLMWKSSVKKLRSGDWPLMWNAMMAHEDGWYENPHPGGLREVDAVGSGCMIIHRRVLEDDGLKPWFEREWTPEGTIRTGSDFLFCRKAKARGWKVWCSYDHPCSHFKEHDITEYYRYLQHRDLTTVLDKKNINTPEYWDEQWGKRGERSYNFYEDIPKKVKGKVLDFGCGRGDLLAVLKDAGVDAEGCDISQKGIDVCKERGLDAWLIEPGQEILKEYGTIVCTEVLEHLDDDAGTLEMFFRHADRVVYTVPNNRLPPRIEPEHQRCYTMEYCNEITPHFKEIINYGDYLMVIGEREQCLQPQ